MTNEEVYQGLKECLVMALGVDEESISRNVSIVDDLGADSLDIVDTIFRVEKKFGLLTSVSEIQNAILGSLSEDEFFDQNRKVTAAGLEQLKKQFPDKTFSKPGTLSEDDLFSLITVDHLVDMIMEKMAQSPSPKKVEG